MHISDGIIITPVCIAADAAALGIIYLSSRNTRPEEIPAMGMTGAALFVASLIHFPLAGTSIHLGLFGMAGIILGKRSFPVIFTALLFQSLIFQHGGLLSVGINSINMGTGAWVAWMIWSIAGVPIHIRALLAGFAGIIVPALLMTGEFRLSGYGSGIALLIAVYALAALIEAAITLSAVTFLKKVKPEIINEKTIPNNNEE
ncbi:MAG: cobalt transporter CbiM [Bacteroidales bacterium]|nr:cobalt transporter CbiM [Bacteroidales bacterium]